MSYPLIILGAGASHDYSRMGKIAPLTNELVDDQFLFSDLLQKYSGAGDLLSDVMHQVKTNKLGFEAVLTEMKEKTKNSSQMRAHFAALQFYLKAVFERLSGNSGNEHIQRMHSINNYKVLINRINTYSEGKACVVTFNYDSLFERNLPSGSPERMRDYIQNDLKIIKLHGSHDWGYIHRKTDMVFRANDYKDNFDFCRKNPNFLESINDAQHEIYHMEEIKKIMGEFHWFPALAVPLVGKETYVCPKNHVKALETILPTVDRILVVGWKAGDPMLLETLQRYLPKLAYKVLVISGSLENAKKIAEVIQKGIGTGEQWVTARGGGFSDFIASPASDEFFSN